MDSQIITGIIGVTTVVLSGAVNVGMWKLQKIADKKKDAAELEKTTAETDNIDSETIQNLIDSIKNLQTLHDEELKKSTDRARENDDLRKDIKKQAAQISMLETSYKAIVLQNEKLIRENEEMKKAIVELTAENAALRKLITDEQIKKGKS